MTTAVVGAAKRSWGVRLFIAAQVAVPTVACLANWLGHPSSWGWQMFSASS